MAACSSCNQILRDGARFCASCGAAQTAAVAVQATATGTVLLEDAEQQQWLSFTRAVVADIQRTGMFNGQEKPVPFARQLDRNEKRIASAPVRVYEFMAPGSGAAQFDSVGTGVISIANPYAGAAYAVGQAFGAAKARQNAIPRWMPAGKGTIVVTDYMGVIVPIVQRIRR